MEVRHPASHPIHIVDHNHRHYHMRLLLPFIVSSSSSYLYCSNSKRACISTISENIISRRRNYNRIQLYPTSSSSLTSRRNFHCNYYYREPKQQSSLLLSLLWNDQYRRYNNTYCYSLTATHKMSTTNDDNNENMNDSNINDNDTNKLLFNVPLIDVDCNLWHDDLIDFTKTLSNNYDIVDCFTILQQDAVMESNIIAMVSPSSTISQSIYGIQQLRLKQEQDQQNHGMIHNVMIRTTVGIHPYHVNDEECISTDIDTLIFETAHDLITNNQDIVIGVGECGLDGSDGFPAIEQQIPYFTKQIQLCEELITEYDMKHLVLFVHERLAFETTFHMLQSSTIPSSNIIIHCFTGTVEECIQYINAGYYISISGYIFRDNINNNSVIDCLQQNLIPINRIMIETDSPYLGFMNCRQYYIQKNNNLIDSNMSSKQRKKFMNAKYPNVPSSLVGILYEIVKNYNIGLTNQNKDLITVEEFAKHCTNNANRLFHFQLPMLD